VITLYDYSGYADVCALGDEVIAAARTIPRAIVISVFAVGAAYVLLNVGVVAALTPKEIAASTTVASLVAERAFGTPFAIGVTIAVLVTAFGSTYGLLLAAARVPFAAARDGDFLPQFARLHPRAGFPSVSLVAIGLLALPASLLPLDVVINWLTAGIVLVQGIAQVVALSLTRWPWRAPRAPFRMPLYPLPPLVALAGWAWLFYSTGRVAIAFGLGTLLLGAAVFLIRARVKRDWPFAATAAALAALALLAAPQSASAAATAPSFGHAVVVQRDGAPRLLVDGKPFFFWGGAFFYERIPASQWRTSMLAMRDLGANTLDLYVPWNWHELADGRFDFDGHTDPRRNLREVLRLGASLGFHFLVRPGPVIRNEWRNGGYPAWLLTRPEYEMPLHDVLEGRYPATATLQNAHSDDAAAEWMRNATHLRYASRWLHRALAEFRPYADRVLAVQLDDDQAAYIDNQTYPAPHLQRYLHWLDAQVREVVGPATPTFINTYQMRVPAASPVWTMGNWYQSDAYTIGTHDRVELDLSTLLLATNRRGPLAQSEFQAGWLAGAEDPRPRAADPRNTTLALDELLALGAQGIVDFPMQDTRAQPGWEAPFSNASYAWDAALPADTVAQPSRIWAPFIGPRFRPTHAFGRLIARLAPVLLAAHRVAPIGIVYGEPAPRADSRPPDGASAGLARVRAALTACIERGLTCDLVDARRPPAHLERYATLVIAPEIAAAAPEPVRALRASRGASHARVAAAVPQTLGSGTTLLAGPAGRVEFAANWSDAPVPVRFVSGAATVPAHDVVLHLDDVALAALGARGDRRRVTSDCAFAALEVAYGKPYETALTSDDGCSVTLRGGSRSQTLRLAPQERLTVPGLHRATAPQSYTESQGVSAVAFTYDKANDAVVTRRHAEALGGDEIVLANDRLRLQLDPQAGARAFQFFALGPAGESRPTPFYTPNAFDATGAFRDDVSAPVPPSPRDYIAKYTHDYPAGTFNRTYRVDVLESGKQAAVRFSYAMPDAAPSGVTFERVVSMAPHEWRVVVDERLIAPAGASLGDQRAVVRSSLPALALIGAGPVGLDPFPPGPPGAAPAENGLATLRDGAVFSVAWRAGDVERASWTAYRSTGTLALTLAPGWRRVTYAYAPAASVDEARRFAQAERTWIAANPAPDRR
jgi:glycosyl hydrolase family 35/amino acid permease-like protein